MAGGDAHPSGGPMRTGHCDDHDVDATVDPGHAMTCACG